MLGSSFILELYEVEAYTEEDPDTGATMHLSRQAPSGATRKFTASALSIEGAITLDNWVRERHMRIVEASTLKLGPAARDAAMAAAANKLPTITWNSAYGAEVLGCIDGMVLFASVILQQNHKELTQEILYTYLVFPENMQRLSEAIRKSATSNPLQPSLASTSRQRGQKYKREKRHKRHKR